MYCRPEVPTYVSERIHAFYVRLQWELMRPSLPDICRMGTAVDRYAPESHAFLGSIFAKMPWAKVLEAMDEPTAVVSQTKLKALPILLKVIVKLSQEPVMRQVSETLLDRSDLPLRTYFFFLEWTAREFGVFTEHSELVVGGLEGV